MHNLLFSKTAVLAVGAFSVLLCYSLPPAETASETTGPFSVERLRLLCEKIDSIEVEKQVKKRNGLPLIELEAKTADFRDSIKTIRLELGQGAAPIAAAAPESKESPQDYIKKLLPGPKNKIYDRILLAVGVVTIFIGIFFFFAVFAFKARSRKQTASQNQTKRVAAQYEEVQKKVAAAQSAYPDSFSNTPSESAALASAIPPSAQTVPKTVPPAMQPHPPAQTSESDLKNLVLKAGKEGLEAKEISKRYHISIDQVALILKMAKKQS
jgi:type II secretory pathway pseudopilin PulG